MTATEIVSELSRLGVRLKVAGDKLRWKPREAVGAEMLEALREHKAEILEALRGVSVLARVRGRDEIVEAGAVDVCWHCHGERTCRCISCAVPAPKVRWDKGPCAACKGTGFLAWPERVQ